MSDSKIPGELAFLPRSSVVLAPLSGYGDLPFRRMCRKHGLIHGFAPMVDASALAIGSKRTMRIAERGEEEQEWFGVQIVGNAPEKISIACEKVATLNPDVIDLNLGCPAPKVRRKGQGCAMLDYPDLVAECVRAMCCAVEIPITVKTRLNAEASAEPVLDLIEAASQAGAKAVTVHARPPKQKYGGPVHLQVLARIVQRSPIPVIGNGGIYSRWHLEQMKRVVDPYGFMVARGTMGAPWLFAHLRGPDPWNGAEIPAEPVADPAPSTDEFVDTIVEHVETMVEYHGRHLGYARTRKLLLRYLKGRGMPVESRVIASKMSSREDLDQLIALIRSGRPPMARFV